MYLIILGNFVENIQKPQIIIALSLALVSLLTMVFAKKIAEKISSDKDKQFGITVKIKFACMFLSIIAVILAVI